MVNPRKLKEKEAKEAKRKIEIAAQPTISPTTSSSLVPSLSNLSISGDQKEDEIKFAPKQYGKEGTAVKLKSNFFKIDLKKNSPNYFHYNIEFIENGNQPQQAKKDSTPKSKKSPKRLHNLIFSALFKKYQNVFQVEYLPVFDGEKNFYSISKFNFSGVFTGDVEVDDKDKKVKFTINITTPEISHDQILINLLKTKSITPVELQALDIVSCCF